MIALILIGIIVAVLLLGGSANGEGDGDETAGANYRNPMTQVEAQIPDGWRALERPIDGVLYPVQVLAAASFPVRVPHHPLGCHPGRVLGQMPADGVLLRIFEYARLSPLGKPMRVPRLPPRPAQFSYGDADYGPFECAGFSYRFTFEQGGRAFQAQIWFDRKTVDPVLRAQALRILDSFHPAGERRRRAGTRKSHEGTG